MVTEEPPACRKCRRPFDPSDKRFDGAAEFAYSGFCGRCVDLCHEATEFDHRCMICVPERRPVE